MPTSITVAPGFTKSPVTISSDAAIDSAIATMMSHGVGALLVTDQTDSLVGILTERDFLTKVAGVPGFEALPVARFMTPNPETVAPTDVLAFALGKMDAGGYRHLPVVLAGKPVGVISVRDVLRHITAVCADG